MTTERLDDFTLAFLECALWSSNDESDESGGEPLDKNYDIEDIAEPCLRALAAQCKRFQSSENIMMMATHNGNGKCGFLEQGGHDFWLTRNGHGAGFWDGDYPQAEGERLTAAAKAFGEVDLYVGDDGQIWASGYEKGKRYGT